MSDIRSAPALPLRFIFAAALLALVAAPLSAEEEPAVETQIIQQTAESDPAAPRYGQSIATRYRVGAKITAKGGTVRNIRIMVAVPLECPEQEVHVLEKDFSPHIDSVQIRTLPDDKRAEPGARQMLITVSELPPRQEAHALITYEVVTKTVLEPADVSQLKIPERPDRQLKQYLSGSPYINVNHRKIREAVKDALAAPDEVEGEGNAAVDGADASDSKKEIESPGDEMDDTGGDDAYELVGADTTADAETSTAAKEESASDQGGLVGVDASASFEADATADPAQANADSTAAIAAPATGDWRKVEKIYDYVQEHVEYEEGAQDKPALDALQDGKGDCHGISALFVAMCRTADVPARMVWVDGHQYAEFYLEGAEGQGHWYPVQSAGTRAFGEMPTPKVILQKGDDFRVPERRRERLRYASDYTLLLAEPRFKPKVQYIREQL